MWIIERIIKGEIKKLLEGKKKEQPSTGLFIKLPEEIARQFPDDRLKTDDSPAHITFLYIGKNYSDEDKDRMVGVIHRVLADLPRCTATLEGVECFTQGTKRIPHVRIKFDPDIRAWKNKVWQALEKEGFEIEDSFFDYEPHSTLAFVEDIPEDEEYEWDGLVPTGEFEVTEIELWGFERDFKFQIGQQEEEQ